MAPTNDPRCGVLTRAGNVCMRRLGHTGVHRRVASNCSPKNSETYRLKDVAAYNAKQVERYRSGDTGFRRSVQGYIKRAEARRAKDND